MYNWTGCDLVHGRTGGATRDGPESVDPQLNRTGGWAVGYLFDEHVASGRLGGIVSSGVDYWTAGLTIVRLGGR